MKTFKFILLLTIFISISGFIFTLFWDIPAPTKRQEKVIELNITSLKHTQPTKMSIQ